jgi:hypothetical protein
MKQPPGFVDSTLPSHVCRLHKSLYGLKQAPRAWYTRLNDFLLSIGFRASKVDTSLFIFSVGVDICYLLSTLMIFCLRVVTLFCSNASFSY